MATSSQLGAGQTGTHSSEPGASPAASHALRSVRIGRRWASMLRRHAWLYRVANKLAWTSVEANLLDTPVRYWLRELLIGGVGHYQLRGDRSHLYIRHRTGDVDILRKFFGYKNYDLPAAVDQRLRALGRPLDVLDLGANIGLFEVFLRERLPVDRVTCFEPDPSNAATLEKVRSANGANWEIVRACASNADGVTMFSGGHQNFSRIRADGDTRVPVKDVFPRAARADVVKMNIEGSEWDILRDPRLAGIGATWIIEYHRIANPDADIHTAAEMLLEEAGYAVRRADPGPDNGLIWAWRE